MIRRIAALSAVLCALSHTIAVAQPGGPVADPAAAPPAAVAAAPAKPAPRTQSVTLQTSAGAIVIAVEVERAPITAANFLAYVDKKRLDGVGFYRAVKVAPGFGLVQGGTHGQPKRQLPPIAHEPTTRTGLTHGDGAVSMARLTPGTASGDFFICVGDMPSMDAHPDQPGDNQGFAVFGHVVSGMDVVRTILAAPTSPTAGEGIMRGQMLAPLVTIVSARRS